MNYVDFVLSFCRDTLRLVYNRALSNLKNLILKFPNSLIWQVHFSLTNYSSYVTFDEAFPILDQLKN